MKTLKKDLLTVNIYSTRDEMGKAAASDVKACILSLLEKKETIKSMLKSKGIQKDNVNIIIGSDNECEVAKDCSIITATYNIDKDVVGKISLIGPTRMDYAKVYSILNYMGLLLNKK